MEVYIVVKGYYSAYRICGVTLDRKEAEELKEKCSSKWEPAKIEVYDTEESKNLIKTAVPVWWIELTEHTFKIDRRDWVYEDDIFENEFNLNRNPNTGKYLFTAIVACVDKDRALKIAYDEKARMIAEEEGI